MLFFLDIPLPENEPQIYLLQTYVELWKVWTQESFEKEVEFVRPGERSNE